MIDERPLAVLRAARLEPAPGSVRNGGVHGGDDDAEGPGGAGGGWDERRRAGSEAELDAPPAGRRVQDLPRRVGVDRDLVVREEEGPQRLPQLDRAREVGRRRAAGLEQPVGAEPVGQGRRARQLLLVPVRVLVEGVDELGDQIVAINHST